MIVNLVHEFYAKCNRTVVILQLCLLLFCRQLVDRSGWRQKKG